MKYGDLIQVQWTTHLTFVNPFMNLPKETFTQDPAKDNAVSRNAMPVH